MHGRRRCMRHSRFRARRSTQAAIISMEATHMASSCCCCSHLALCMAAACLQAAAAAPALAWLLLSKAAPRASTEPQGLVGEAFLDRSVLLLLPPFVKAAFIASWLC